MTVHAERRRTEAYARGGVSPEPLLHADPILLQPAMLWVDGLDTRKLGVRLVDLLREEYGLELVPSMRTMAELAVQHALDDALQDELDSVEGVF